MITPAQLARSSTEDGEQAALFCHAQIMEAQDWRWSLLAAIPNGGKRGVATAARLASTGTRAGFPDIILPVVATRYSGMFIELKRTNAQGKPAGVVKPAQKMWHARLQAQGYFVAICYGWEHAAKEIETYLGR